MVRNPTNFGVFIELEEASTAGPHLRPLLDQKSATRVKWSKGERLDRGHLGIDVDQRRISLGKQVKDYPDVRGRVQARCPDRGEDRPIIESVIVELPTVWTDSSPRRSRPLTGQAGGRLFQVGDSLPLHVIEFDKDSKKIVPSVVEYLKGKDQAVIDDYAWKHQLPAMTRTTSPASRGEPVTPTAYDQTPTSDFLN